MLLLFCAAACLFVGLFFGLSVSLMFIPGALTFLIRVLPFMCDFIFSFMQFIWQILSFVVLIVYTVVRNLTPLFMDMIPVITYVINNIIAGTCNVANAVLGFIYTAEEHAAIVAGIVIATIYYYINQIRDILNHFEQPAEYHLNQTHNLHQVPDRRNRLYPDIPDNLYQDTINENENNANQQNEVDMNTIETENERNREVESHRTHRVQNIHRLYPNLPTVPTAPPAPPGHQGDGDWEPQDGDQLCVVCFERQRDTALFPCGHTQFCQGCTLSIRDRSNLCPICQGRIVEHRHVFV